MKPYAKLLLLILIPMMLVMGYAMSSFELGTGDYVLQKADLSGVGQLFLGFIDSRESVFVDSIQRADSLARVKRDSLAQVEADSLARQRAIPSDAHILMIGDSMLEGLIRRMDDYTTENGYQLSGVIWYSSTTHIWAITDTLEYYLDSIQPDYVMLCLGANELFVRDLPKREQYISTIIGKLGTRPFVWIGPPNWTRDTGINDLIGSMVGEDRFFDSRNLELERAEDRIHPTRWAAAQWMDSIALWMNGPKVRHPLPMHRPEKRHRGNFQLYLLKPYH